MSQIQINKDFIFITTLVHVTNPIVWFRILQKSHTRCLLFWLVPRRAPYTWWYLIPLDNDYDT